MSAIESLDIEAWNRYFRGEYVADRLPTAAEPKDEEPGGARLRPATHFCLRCHRAVSPTQAREYTQFADRGRRQTGRYAVGVVAEDLHDENEVIGDDGEWYVIDPALYLDDRGKGLRLRRRAEELD